MNNNNSPQARLKRQFRMRGNINLSNHILPWPTAQQMIEFLMSKGVTKKEAKMAVWNDYVSQCEEYFNEQ